MIMPARRLTRIGWSGRGCRSIPSGDSIGLTTGWFLSSVFTDDLHSLSLLARSKNQLRVIEQAVHYVRPLLYAVVRHLAFAITAENHQRGRFAILQFQGHLDVGLRAVIEHAKGPDVFGSTGDLVAEVHSCRGD